MLDLHGAPGGQNGFDNRQVTPYLQSSDHPSGIRGTREWFSNNTNIARTLTALQILTAEFTQASYGDTVQTIELINEPFPWIQSEIDTLRSFYQSAYGTVRNAKDQSQEKIVVAIDEGFQGLSAWNGFMTEPEYHDVALDTVCHPFCRRRNEELRVVAHLCDVGSKLGFWLGMLWVAAEFAPSGST